MTYTDQLAKELEEGRAARRERARAAAAMAFDPREREAEVRSAQAGRPFRAKRNSQAAFARIEKEIDAGIADFEGDNPDYEGDPSVAHDIAWSVLHHHLDEHPEVIRRVCLCYGIDPDVFRRRTR